MSKDSLGERVARVEAELRCLETLEEDLQAQLDRRLAGEESSRALARELYDEKILGVSKELRALNTAQKEAVDKAERSTVQQIDLLRQQADRRSEVVNQRLGALESGEAGRHGANELKASTIAWIGALAALGLIILYFVHP